MPTPDRGIWLKPWGCSEDPISSDEDFTHTDQALFSKNMPGVEINDWLVCYAVGHRRITSVLLVKTIAQPYRSSKRWPWFVKTRNLTEGFGMNWFEHELNPFEISREFRRLSANVPLTGAGGNTLGAINFGTSALKLSDQFGKFLIAKINAKLGQI